MPRHEITIRLVLPEWSRRRWLGVLLGALIIGGAAYAAGIWPYAPPKFTAGEKLSASSLTTEFGKIGEALTDLNGRAVPSGAIMMFGNLGGCPMGWTRVAELDGRFARGAMTAGGRGGSDTHLHSVVGSTADGQAFTSGGGGVDKDCSMDYGTSIDPCPRRLHNHGISLQSGAASSWPPYLDVLFCRKD